MIVITSKKVIETKFNKRQMKVDVFDTHVVKKNGQLMNFDILVPEGTSADIVYGFGREYLKSKGEDKQPITATECRLCHVELAPESVQESIRDQGYHIIELRGC
jgi:hypothetical protein